MICIRCHEEFGTSRNCSYCGVGRDRPVRQIHRTNKIGGKRGRNSGTVHTAKKK